MITNEKLDQMEKCADLLGEPATEVVKELIAEIRSNRPKGVGCPLGKESVTNRGFQLVEFEDYYRNKCSLQQSSLMEDDENHGYLWLGIHQERMHLDREQVQGLVSRLTTWLENGDILDPRPKDISYLANPSPPANPPIERRTPTNLSFVQGLRKRWEDYKREKEFEEEIQERLKGEPRLPEFGFQRHDYQDILEGVAGAMLESTTILVNKLEIMQELVRQCKPNGEIHLTFTRVEERDGRLCLVAYTKTKDDKTKYLLHHPIKEEYLKKYIK